MKKVSITLKTYLCIFLFSWAVQAHLHECIHDTIDFEPTINHLSEEARKNHFRNLATQTAPIRISPDYRNIGSLSSQNLDFLENKLVPAVISYFTSTIQLTPQTGALTFSSSVCYTAAIDSSYSTTGVYTDLVLFIQTNLTTASTVASGLACILDSITGRPIAGYLNFNPSTFSTSNDAWSLIYRSTLHEMFHILGFSRSLFSVYIFSDGTRRNDVLQNVTSRGILTQSITLSQVVQKARIHFSCSSITGLELENQDGTYLTSSHWERRVLGNELMTISVNPNNVVSDMTLGLLEGTGWYTINYTKTETLAWGNNRGCSFLTSLCVNNVTFTPISNEFCSSLNAHGCTADYTTKALCSVQVGAPQYAIWNYYNNNTVSTDTYADNCPYMIPYSNADCRNANYDTKEVLFEEKYGDNSACFVGTLTKSAYSLYYNPGFQRGMCYNYKCTSSGTGYTLQITIGTQTITCPSGFNQVSVSGYSGYIICPDPSEYCGRVMCTLGCSGNGVCANGICICNSGYTGSDCSEKVCQNGCSGKGACATDNSCSCTDGWGGDDCSSKNLVGNCTKCGNILDCYGDNCECYPYPGRDCV